MARERGRERREERTERVRALFVLLSFVSLFLGRSRVVTSQSGRKKQEVPCAGIWRTEIEERGGEGRKEEAMTKGRREEERKFDRSPCSVYWLEKRRTEMR